MATNQNNTNNTNNNTFTQELDAAISKLDSLDKALDSSNSHISELGDSFKKLAEGIDSLDGRKARKLQTISQNIKSVLEILNNYKIAGINVTSEFINKFTEAVNNLNKIEIDMTNIDNFTKSMEGINNQLKDFIKLSKGLGAVDLSKLENLNIEIKNEDGTTVKDKNKYKDNDQKIINSVRRYVKMPKEVLEAEIRAKEGDLAAKSDTSKQKIDMYSTYTKMKLARGDYTNGISLKQLQEEGKLQDIQLGIAKRNEDLKKKTDEILNKINQAKEERKKAKEEELNRKIEVLTRSIDSGTGTLREVQRLTNIKKARGDFETDEERDKFFEEQKSKLKEETERNLDQEIERAQENKEGKNAIAYESREDINSRTYINAEAKRNKALWEQAFNQENIKGKAISNLLTRTVGISGSALNDIMALLPKLDEDAKKIQKLKDNRKVIDDNFNIANRNLTNKEMTEIKIIKGEGLSEEQRRLLNNPKLTEDQRNKILNSSLSDEEVAEKINKVRLETSKKRVEIADNRDRELIKNEEALALASQEAAGKLTKVAISIKLFTLTTKELYKVSKQAAQANTSMVASLKSMGASSSEVKTDSIKYFTNELENISQRLKTIGREFGETFEGLFSGFTLIFDGILSWVEDAVTALNDLLPDGLKLEAEKKKEKNINYSTSVLESIANRLNHGLIVDGVEIKVDKEVAYKALSSSFGGSKTQGFDNKSSANMASNIANMASKIQANYGVDYTTATQALNDAIFNGSNSASTYGIIIDDQILAGYAAMVRGIDLVNVEYTDAYKSALRLKMAQDMIANGNSEKMNKKIKQWKQFGDVIQTASGQLFDFQEVQSIEAKDFTIPDIKEDGNILGELTDEQNKIIDSYEGLNIESIGGELLTIDQAMQNLNMNVNSIYQVFDTKLNKSLLVTKERFKELEKLDPGRFKFIANGTEAIGRQADSLNIALDDLMAILGYAGLTKSEIAEAMAYLEASRRLNIDYSDLTNILSKQKDVDELASSLTKEMEIHIKQSDLDETITKLRIALHLKSQLENEEPPGDKIGTIMSNDYVKYKLGIADNNTTSKAQYIDNNIKDRYGNLGKFLVGAGNFVGTAADIALKTNPFTQIPYAIMNIADNKKDGNIDLPSMLNFLEKKEIPGHYNGGISTKEHIARISEGNANEAIVNLDSQQGINALSTAMGLALQGQSQQGINVEKIEVKNEGINIGDDMKWRKVAQRLADEMATLDRERGVINNGIK